MRQFRLFLAAASALCTVALHAYVAPIGIPHPAEHFGGLDPIETAKPVPQSYAPGWYAPTPRPNAKAFGDANDCYYVDNAHPNATDSSNPYGHPNKPRRTIPNATLSAGAYVQIHGGAGQRYGETFRPAGVGTPSSPIWFVGVNNPTLTATCDIGFSNQSQIAYIVFDGISWLEGGKVDLRPRYDNNQFHHLVFRHCVFRGQAAEPDATGVSVGASSYSPTRTTRNIVFYNCEVSHYGDKNKPGEECGVYPRFFVENFWFIDGSVHNNAEDGFGGSHGGKHSSTGYYIGRNKIYNNLTNAIDIKGMRTVVISENEISGHYDTWVNGEHKSSGQGEAIVVHYAGNSTGSDVFRNFPEDVSVLFNRISGSRYAVATSSQGRLRVIGNVIYNIHSAPTNYTTKTEAIYLAGIKDDHWILNNTIYNSDGGIRVADNAPAAYSPANLYYKSERVTHDGLLYVCIDDNDGAGVSGISPENPNTWRAIRLRIWGNIIAGRTKSDQADIRFDVAGFAPHADVDHNLTFHGSWGEAYQYGGGGLRDLSWVKSNTGHQANGLAADPYFLNAQAHDFSLTSQSPAINASTEEVGMSGYTDFEDRFGLNIRLDAAGQPRTTAIFDLGALEFHRIDGSPPAPPSGLLLNP